MKFSLTLLDSTNEIQKNILIALQNILEKAINSSIREVSENIKDIVERALKSQPEYNSLINGELRYHFGISDTSNVDIVISQLINTLKVEIKPITLTPRGLGGGYVINMINSQDFGGVLSSDASFVVDSKGGYKLPWLEWLLLRNNEYIVKNYDIKLGPNPYSRSGGAVMVASNSSWRVPPEFAGSKNSNWITRALENVDAEIIKTMETTLVSQL